MITSRHLTEKLEEFRKMLEEYEIPFTHKDLLDAELRSPTPFGSEITFLGEGSEKLAWLFEDVVIKYNSFLDDIGYKSQIEVEKAVYDALVESTNTAHLMPEMIFIDMPVGDGTKRTTPLVIMERVDMADERVISPVTGNDIQTNRLDEFLWEYFDDPREDIVHSIYDMASIITELVGGATSSRVKGDIMRKSGNFGVNQYGEFKIVDFGFY